MNRLFHNYDNLNKNNKVSANYKKEKLIPVQTKFEKGILNLSRKDFLPTNKSPLEINKTYVIIKSLWPTHGEKQCSFGFFKMTDMNKSYFKLKPMENISSVRLEKYAFLTKSEIKYELIAEEDFYNFSKIISCKNWVNIVNLAKKNNKIIFDYYKSRNLKLRKNFCGHISEKNILSITSYDSSILYYAFDYESNQIKICGKKSGVVNVALLNIAPFVEHFETITLSLEKNLH